MGRYKKYFINCLRDNYPENSGELIAETEKNYREISPDIAFSRKSKNPIDRRLDFCAYFLALVKTLDHIGEPYEKIRKISLEIVIEYVRPKTALQAFMKRVPAKLIGTPLAKSLVKLFHKKISTNNNKEGFIANIITDKQETFGLGYGIDILECGICKLFNKHHFEKYAPILCEVDEVTSGLAGLTLIRNGTIANGAKKCDFRFKKTD